MVEKYKKKSAICGFLQAKSICIACIQRQSNLTVQLHQFHKKNLKSALDMYSSSQLLTLLWSNKYHKNITNTSEKSGTEVFEVPLKSVPL